jgi:hypothetical protein
MRSKLLLATCTALLGLVVGWLIGRPPAAKPETTDTAAKPPAEQPEAKVPVMPPPRKPGPEWFNTATRVGKPIPLAEVYGTTGQTGLKAVPFRRDPESKEEYEELRTRLQQLGCPLIFVVRAATVHAALTETLDVLTRNGLTDEVANRGADKPGEPEVTSFWCFVYLGTAAGGRSWAIDGVSLAEGQLTVRYSTPLTFLQFPPSTPVIHAYWIPLGRLHPGTFILRVQEREGEADTFSRRVRIGRRTP